MNQITSSIKNFFKARTNEQKPTGQEPIATSSEISTWNNLLTLGDNRRREVVKAYRTVYRSGGIVRTAIDTYSLFLFSGGWQLQSDDENEETQKTIMDLVFSRTADFDHVIQQMTQDALCIGDGYAKILKGSGRLSNTPVALQHIPAERIKPHTDETLSILWYDFYDAMQTQILGKLDPADILHICLMPGGGSTYDNGLFGVGLLESAWDDIRHDVDTSEGAAAAIKRHGYGIWHAKVGSTDPEKEVTRGDIQNVKDTLRILSSRSEIVTSANIDIIPLNETGQTNIATYADWSVTRLCTALGIPGELLGLRQGTTDATAVSRIENFYKKIRTYQTTLAHAINTQYIDTILKSLGKKEGTVWIEYADPSPEDNIKRATYLSQIAAITPGDPYAIMSQQQMQIYLGIDHDQWAKDEEYEEPAAQEITDGEE